MPPSTDRVQAYEWAINLAAAQFGRYGRIVPLEVRRHVGSGYFSYSPFPGDCENGMREALSEIPTNRWMAQLPS